MKYINLLYFSFFITNALFAPDVITDKTNQASNKTRTNEPISETTRIIHTEFERHLEDANNARIKAKKAQRDADKAQKEADDIQRDDKITNSMRRKKTTDLLQKKDNALQERDNAIKETEDALQKARDKYRQHHNDGLSKKEFVNLNINTDHITSVYKSDLDASSKQLSEDLYNIDPHLFTEYNDQAYAVRTKPETLTATDFQGYEMHPRLLIDTTSYVPGETAGRKLRSTPLEEAIELKDVKSIKKIFKIIKDPVIIKKARQEGFDISAEALTQPLIDKYVDIFHEKGNDAASKYITSLEDLNIPELTKALNEQTAMLYFQWALDADDIEVAKNVLSHAKQIRISQSLIADQLADRYNYLLKYKGKKEASRYLLNVHKLDDDSLYSDLYYKLFPTK